MEVRQGVGAEPLGRAVAGEIDAPADDMRYGAVAQEHGRILLAEPFDDLRGHARLGPGLDLAGMDDAAVSPAGFHGRFRLALDQHYVVAGFPEIPGRGRADHARAENHRLHRLPPPVNSAGREPPGAPASGPRAVTRLRSSGSSCSCRSRFPPACLARRRPRSPPPTWIPFRARSGWQRRARPDAGSRPTGAWIRDRAR